MKINPKIISNVLNYMRHYQDNPMATSCYTALVIEQGPRKGQIHCGSLVNTLILHMQEADSTTRASSHTTTPTFAARLPYIFIKIL